MQFWTNYNKLYLLDNVQNFPIINAINQPYVDITKISMLRNHINEYKNIQHRYDNVYILIILYLYSRFKSTGIGDDDLRNQLRAFRDILFGEVNLVTLTKYFCGNMNAEDYYQIETVEDICKEKGIKAAHDYIILNNILNRDSLNVEFNNPHLCIRVEAVVIALYIKNSNNHKYVWFIHELLRNRCVHCNLAGTADLIFGTEDYITIVHGA